MGKAGGPHPAPELRFPEVYGRHQTPFLSRWEPKWCCWGKRAAVALPLARVSGYISWSDPLSWSANARDSNLRGCRYPSLSAHGLYRTMLRAAEEFNLNYSNVRYIRGMYGFSMFFFFVLKLICL